MGYRLKVMGYRLKVIAFLLGVWSFAHAQELLNYPLDTVNGEEVYRYEVERSIGLYRISVNFGVPQGDIIRLNPQLSERGLHYGETIIIPTGRPVIIESAPVVVSETVTETVVTYEPAPVQEPAPAQEEAVAEQETVSIETAAVVTEEVTGDGVQVTGDGVQVTEDSIQLTEDGRRIIELALLLPFESQQTKRSNNADRMLEFYQGALLALQSLQNDSTLFRLRVHDTERSERRINALCDSTELNHVKGVLGVVFPIQIERMAQWCETHQVPLLLPFSDDEPLAKRPHVLQFNSTDTQEADSLCRWLTERDSLIQCTLIDVREADMSESVRALLKQMKANNIPCTKLPLRDLMNDSAAYAMSTERENVILLHSDKYQHVRILLPHLIKLEEQGYRIRIISQYSWQKEDIALPQVYTSVFTAEADREAYDTLWESYFTNGHVSAAPRYDLLGYDLMRTLVAWLQGEQQTSGLQSDIRWEQVEEGGWQNASIKVIEN